jgi:putative peptidoglycan lipid II flippase
MQWYVVLCFGAGAETDALYVGATIPLLVSGILVQSFKSVLIPLLAAEQREEQERQVWFIAALSGVAFSLLTAIVYFSAPILIPLLAPGFNRETLETAVWLTRIQSLGIVGGAVYAIFLAGHYLKDQFLLPPIATLLSTLLGLIFLVWKLPASNIDLAAWVQAAIATAPAIILAAFAGKMRMPQWNFAMWRLIGQRIRPLIAVRTYALIGTPVDRWLASTLPPGSIVILDLVSRFYGALVRIIVQGVLTPYFPRLSEHASKGRWEEYSELLRKQSSVMLAVGSIVAVVTAAGALVLKVWAAAGGDAPLLGNVTGDQLENLSTLVLLMVAFVPVTCLSESQVNGFYAAGDTSTPTRIGAVVLTFSIVLKVIGMFLGGIEGMALAATLAAGIYTVALHRRLKAASPTRVSEAA